MTYWFTSDTHFGHTNIIEYCNRPFYNVHSMNIHLELQWNLCVKQDDTVYHLGDFSLGNKLSAIKILQSLKGSKQLIRGNHDRRLIREAFDFCFDTLSLENISCGGCGKTHNIFMKHKPNLDINLPNGWWFLHGHVHAKSGVSVSYNDFDVGVDAHDYKPISLEQICKIVNG